MWLELWVRFGRDVVSEVTNLFGTLLLSAVHLVPKTLTSVSIRLKFCMRISSVLPGSISNLFHHRSSCRRKSFCW